LERALTGLYLKDPPAWNPRAHLSSSGCTQL